MANWKKHLDVSDVWMAETVQKLGQIVAQRLQEIYPELLDEYSEEFDEEFSNIVHAFQQITGYDEVTPVEEFDDWWETLYNWADIDHKLWISTF